MSGEAEDDDDKEHEPSPQKLLEARKRGDIPRSADLLAAVAVGGFLFAVMALGHSVIEGMGTAAMVILDQADRLGPLMTSGALAPMAGLLLAIVGPPVALLTVAPVFVLAVAVAMRGVVLTPGNLAPKLSRISPLAAARHKFGSEGLVQFAKSTAKLCLISAVLYVFLAARLDDFLSTASLSPGPVAKLLVDLTVEFLLIVLGIMAVLGGVDHLWQVHLHRRRNRMSRKEMMDEFKESEGDPHLKSARRQRAQSVAMNRMLADIPTADVVVVNPTHYAVALRWDRAKGGAPVCVAKGVDEIAAVIRQRAAEHGVPLHRDPPTARAIHATVEIGDEIRAEHYRAVAAAIRFADAMRRKARKT
jgi:flagellar biosynthesis protein FlhB